MWHRRVRDLPADVRHAVVGRRPPRGARRTPVPREVRRVHRHRRHRRRVRRAPRRPRRGVGRPALAAACAYCGDLDPKKSASPATPHATPSARSTIRWQHRPTRLAKRPGSPGGWACLPLPGPRHVGSVAAPARRRPARRTRRQAARSAGLQPVVNAGPAVRTAPAATGSCMSRWATISSENMSPTAAESCCGAPLTTRCRSASSPA